MFVVSNQTFEKICFNFSPQIDKQIDIKKSVDVRTFRYIIIRLKRLGWFWNFSLTGLDLPYESPFFIRCFSFINKQEEMLTLGKLLRVFKFRNQWLEIKPREQTTVGLEFKWNYTSVIGHALRSKCIKIFSFSSCDNLNIIHLKFYSLNSVSKSLTLFLTFN